MHRSQIEIISTSSRFRPQCMQQSLTRHIIIIMNHKLNFHVFGPILYLCTCYYINIYIIWSLKYTVRVTQRRPARSPSKKCLRQTLTEKTIIIHNFRRSYIYSIDRSRKIVSMLSNQTNKSIACPLSIIMCNNSNNSATRTRKKYIYIHKKKKCVEQYTLNCKMRVLCKNSVLFFFAEMKILLQLHICVYNIVCPVTFIKIYEEKNQTWKSHIFQVK